MNKLIFSTLGYMLKNFKRLSVPMNKFVNYVVEKLFTIVKVVNLCNAMNAEFVLLGTS